MNTKMVVCVVLSVVAAFVVVPWLVSLAGWVAKAAIYLLVALVIYAALRRFFKAKPGK